MRQRFDMTVGGIILDEFARTVDTDGQPWAYGGDTAWPTTKENHMTTAEFESTAVNRINQIAANLASGGNFAGVARQPADDQLIDLAASHAANTAYDQTRERLAHRRDIATLEERRERAEMEAARLRRGIIAAGPGAAEIAHERARHQEHEGYHPINDLHNRKPGDLLEAALCYGTAAVGQLRGEVEDGVGRWFPEAADMTAPGGWPFGEDQWKPTDDPRRNLEKAGALIAAEIDRIDLQRARDDIAADAQGMADAAERSATGQRKVTDRPQA